VEQWTHTHTHYHLLDCWTEAHRNYCISYFTVDKQVAHCKEQSVDVGLKRINRYLAIIIQQGGTEYSKFKSVNCSTCFGWHFTHHQELTTLYLQYLALMRLVLLTVVNVAGQELSSLPAGTSTGLINARYCRYSVMNSWWWVEIPPETCWTVDRFK